MTVQADSLDTKRKKRDEHLRSADFFDVERHAEVRFVSDTVTVDGDVLSVTGQLHAAGKAVPLRLEARVPRSTGSCTSKDTPVDHRELGMTWSPLGILRSPSTLSAAAGSFRTDRHTLDL